MKLYEDLGYADVKLPGVYDAADHVLSLPVHPEVTESEIQYIADELRAALNANQVRARPASERRRHPPDLQREG